MSKVFYHAADFDGIASAAILRWVPGSLAQRVDGAEFVAINYGDRFPWEKIESGEAVTMVDFSLQPFSEMMRLDQRADLFWIDHHGTAIEAAIRAKAAIYGLQREGYGGCELTWECCFPGAPLRRPIYLLGRYDVWDHKDPDTLPFQYGLRSKGWAMDPCAVDWKSLLLVDSVTSDIIASGRNILAYVTSQNAIAAKGLCFSHILPIPGSPNGLACIAANVGHVSSKFFESVWNDEYDAMLTFVFRTGQWHCSLYAIDPEIDVGEIAAQFGGGGHRGAAGFQTQTLAELGL